MLVGRILFAACMIALAGAAVGQELGSPEPEPGSLDPVRVRLLDDVPNYAKVLKDQWSTTIRPVDNGHVAGHYGLLRDHVQPRAITLEESIGLALENNTGLRIQKLNPIAATARVRQAYAQFDPELFGNVQKTRNHQPANTINVITTSLGDPDTFFNEVDWNAGARKRFLTGGVLTGEFTNNRIVQDATFVNLLSPAYSTGLNLTLNQPLLRDFGWRFALLVVDVAQIGEEQSYYEYRADVSVLVENVERAYWTYVLAIESVSVEERGLELAKELLRQNQGRFKVGALARTAVLESEAEVARREADLVRSRALERIARDNLRALINARDPSADALLMIHPADKPTVVAAEVDLDESLRTAYRHRPELIAARLNADGRAIERRIAENALLPRLDLVGSIGAIGLGGDAQPPLFQNLGGGTPAPGATPASIANPQVVGGYNRSLEILTNGRYYQYLIGAQLSIPIANAAAKANYAQAKVNSEQARLDVERLEEDVTHEITESANNLEAFLKAIEARRIARELAEENVRNQQARYDVGLATTKDLIDFQDRLTQAQRAEVDALTGYNIELARFRFAQGTLLRDRNIVLERTEPEPPPWWARF
jgi:outer membrane protein TolC